MLNIFSVTNHPERIQVASTGPARLIQWSRLGVFVKMENVTSYGQPVYRQEVLEKQGDYDDILTC